jgi:hypothetical protein
LTATTPESRARIAYAAYGHATGFKNFLGHVMPDFDDLRPKQRDGWIAAAGVIWSLATTGRAEIS